MVRVGVGLGFIYTSVVLGSSLRTSLTGKVRSSEHKTCETQVYVMSDGSNAHLFLLSV